MPLCHDIQPRPSSSYPGQHGFTTLHPSQHRPTQFYPRQPSGHHRPHFVPLHPDLVVEKYTAMKTPAAMSTVAVKLACESFFGEHVMEQCTPQGRAVHDSLPNVKLYLV